MKELSADDDLELIITIDSSAPGGVTAMILYFDMSAGVGTSSHKYRSGVKSLLPLSTSFYTEYLPTLQSKPDIELTSIKLIFAPTLGSCEGVQRVVCPGPGGGPGARIDIPR